MEGSGVSQNVGMVDCNTPLKCGIHHLCGDRPLGPVTSHHRTLLPDFTPSPAIYGVLNIMKILLAQKKGHVLGRPPVLLTCTDDVVLRVINPHSHLYSYQVYPPEP